MEQPIVQVRIGSMFFERDKVTGASCRCDYLNLSTLGTVLYFCEWGLRCFQAVRAVSSKLAFSIRYLGPVWRGRNVRIII